MGPRDFQILFGFDEISKSPHPQKETKREQERRKWLGLCSLSSDGPDIFTTYYKSYGWCGFDCNPLGQRSINPLQPE